MQAHEERVRDERTKVVATLGPASGDPALLGRMLDAGLDVVRLNFSHGTGEEHLKRMAMVRGVSAERGGRTAILADLQGPKIRVGLVPPEGIQLDRDEQCELVAGAESAPPPAVPIVYERLAVDVTRGDRILLDDGAIELLVRDVHRDRVRCTVLQGGLVRSRKGVNLPGVPVSAESLTDKDRADLALALQGGVDYVALSFVRRASDVVGAREVIRTLGGDVPIVAKLERPEALDDLDDILLSSDGVMVARGDLGVEIAVEKVPSLQKRIIARANALGVPVITATQMLESMVASPRPTRAESSDVANAVFDGTDAVMLSGETAVGRFPVQAVEAMVRITCEAEATPQLVHPPPPAVGALDVAATVCKAAVAAAADLGARAVVAFTETGATARLVSRFRPRAPVIGLTPFEHTRRRMALYWGVEPAPCIPRRGHLHEMIAESDLRLVAGGWVVHGDLVVVVAGTPGGVGATNRVIVHRVGASEAANRR